jgi:hypothetical protein
LFIYEGLPGAYPAFDTEHAIDRFRERFPAYSLKTFYKILNKGLRKIEKVYNFSENHYVIISNSTRIKIPIEVRLDKYDVNKLIVAIATTLHADLQPENKYKGIEVIVEKYNYQRYPLMESKECENAEWYYSFIEDNILYKTYKVIEID